MDKRVVPLLQVGPCPPGSILTILGGDETTNRPKKAKALHYGHSAAFFGDPHNFTPDSTTSFIVEVREGGREGEGGRLCLFN